MQLALLNLVELRVDSSVEGVLRPASQVLVEFIVVGLVDKNVPLRGRKICHGHP